MPENASPPGGTSQSHNPLEPIFKFLGKMGDLAAIVMEDAPSWAKLLTFIVLCVLVVVIVAVAGIGGLSGTQTYWLSLAALGLFLVALLTIFVKQFQKKGKTVRDHPKVPVQPLPAAESSVLSDLLGEIRDKAFEYLDTDAKIDRIQNDDVRANVFLFDNRTKSGTDVCTLYMPEDLRKNMLRPKEWELRFKTGQGVTGLVYDLGHHRITHRLSGDRREWEKEFKLNRKQIASIHPELKWIVSFPIKVPGVENVWGVLNVDGLKKDIVDETLEKMCSEALQGNVTSFAVAISQAPSMRILEVR